MKILATARKSSHQAESQHATLRRSVFPERQRQKMTDEPLSRYAPNGFQAKLGVSESGDRYEQEADRIADQVVGAPEMQAQQVAPGNTALSGNGIGVAPPLVDEVLRKSGHPLSRTTRAYFEPRFGHDFSQVRVHTDTKAAQSAQAVNALAYTVGQNIAFAKNQYQPASRHGQRLLAHELVHTIQQTGDQGHLGRLQVQRIPQNPADTPFNGEIVPATTSLRLTASPTGKVLATLPRGHQVIVKALTAWEVFTGGTPWIEVDTNIGGQNLQGHVFHTHIGRHDQRVGTEVPDVDEQKKIGAELDPNAFVPATPPPVTKGSPPVTALPPTRVQWDGLTSNPGHVKNRSDLAKKLTTGLTAFLASEQPHVAAEKALGRIAMKKAGTGKLTGQDTGVQGIADAASNVLENRYGANMNAGVRTPAQLASRSAPMNADPSAGSNQNLFDAYSKVARKRAKGVKTDAELAFGVAWWAIQHVPQCTTPAVKAHHLSPGWHPTPVTQEWKFTETFLKGFVSKGTNETELIDYNLFRQNDTTPSGIFLLTTFDPATHGGHAGKAERASRWEIFSTAIHETVHFRSHPIFDAADKGRGTMLEGFTEMFAKDAADPAFTNVRTGKNEPLRTAVEGVSAKLDASLIPVQMTVGSEYHPAWTHAEAVKKEVGEAAVRAAFFQGHVELLGLEPDGADSPGLRAKGATFMITKPPGVKSLAALATATGLTVVQIKSANPGITDSLLPAMELPGCREHLVVGTSDSTGASAVEDRKQIATQHGVTEAELVRANPDITVIPSLTVVAGTWVTLRIGQKILIPKH